MLVITVRNLYFVDNVATRKYIRLKLSYFISGGKLSFNLQGIKIRKTGEIIWLLSVGTPRDKLHLLVVP